jgi:NAD(P)H-dependent flavin oxidoreductase YrpB (nitropropane dioxygenase family)
MTSHGSLRTPVCELLAIHYPIIQAGMAGATTPRML